MRFLLVASICRTECEFAIETRVIRTMRRVIMFRGCMPVQIHYYNAAVKATLQIPTKTSDLGYTASKQSLWSTRQTKTLSGVGRCNCGLHGNGRHTFIYNLIVLMRSMSKLGVALVLLLVVSAVAQENEDAAYLQMRRTACLVLSRYHSNTQKETIQSAVQALPPTDQNRYINKLYAVAVLTCEESISQSEVQEFYVDNSNFDPSGFFYLLEGVDYGSIASNLDTTKEQEAVIKFAKKFDEEMQIKQEETKAQSEQEGGAVEKYEMKFLGISISDLPESAKLIYVCIFAALVGGALWYGLSQLDDKKEKPSNKRRKSPKKDQSKKD